MNDTINTTLANAQAAALAVITAHANDADYDQKRILEMAKKAWLMELPALVDRAAVKTFIACAARGLQSRILTPSEAKAMIFIAQTLLSALRDEQAEDPAFQYARYADRPRRRVQQTNAEEAA